MTTHPFVAQLAELCRSERTRAKWVVVPNHAVGLALGDRLAREGTDWANVRFVTPFDLATRIAAPFLIERGLDPSGEQLGPALTMRLMLDLPESGGYFRPMAEHPSMADALWRTVRELRYAGVRAAHLAATDFTANVEKRAEIVALLSAYERHLETAHAADKPAVLEEATRHLEWSPIAAADIVIELPTVIWSRVERQFLDSLSGHRVVSRALAVPHVAMPRRITRLGPAVELTDFDVATDAKRLRFLQSPAASGPPRSDGTLEIFHAGGHDAQVDEVFRRILAAGRSLDEIEIACASERYQWLVCEKAMRFGWKVTLSAGVPAVTTRPGRLLLRYCDWIGGNWAAADLRRLLQSGDCAPRAWADEGDSALSSGQAARLLLKAQATCGRATYGPSLTRSAEKYERRALDAERSEDERAWNGRKARQTRELLEWVGQTLSGVPDPSESPTNKVSLASFVEGLCAFLEDNAARRSAIDAAAHAALVDAIADLKALGDYHCSLNDALGFVRARVASLTVGHDRPCPGHLHVSSLAETGYHGRRLVFVVGLQESGVFPAAVEDPVLLDDERRAIDPLLRTSTDALDESVFATLSALAAIGASADRVCLSFSCFDTRDFRQTFPSWLILQAFRLTKGDPALNYDDLAKWLGDPASAVPQSATAALSESDWWMAQAGRTPVAHDAILRVYPSLADGIHAEEERASDLFTEFDGYVPIAGPVLDPTASPRPMSATTLEKAAKCPLRFFIEQGLGVRAIEENRADDDAWLDSLTKGTELHALFARIMRAVRDEKRKPSLTKDRQRLLGWGRQRLGELRREMPPPSDDVFERESREFLDDLEAFIEAECDGRHGGEAIGLEVSFGYPPDETEAEPLASPDPVAIDLGGKRRLLLHGRIDRINRTGKPGEYDIIDYKTGGYSPKTWRGQFAGGRRLQHALYGVAATELLRRKDPKARVIAGTYVFPSVKGHGYRRRIPSPAEATLAAVVRDLADVIANGAFVPADDGESCRWCEFKSACHAENVERAASKRDNTANQALEPYKRLRDNP